MGELGTAVPGRAFAGELRRAVAPLRCRILVAAPSIAAIGGVMLGRLRSSRSGSVGVLAVMLERAHYELGWQLMASIWLVGVVAAAFVGPFLGAEALAGERERGALALRVLLVGRRSVVVRRAVASWCWLACSMVAACAVTAAAGLALAAAGAIDTNVEFPTALAQGFVVSLGVASASWVVSLLTALRVSTAPAVVAGTAFYIGAVIVRELTGTVGGVVPAMSETEWIRSAMLAVAVRPEDLLVGVAWFLLGLVAAAAAAGSLRVE